MVRVREYCEAIALDRGEGVERRHLDRRFLSVLGNYLKLIRARKNLIWFSSFFGQAALVFPLPGGRAALLRRRHHRWGNCSRSRRPSVKCNDSLSWFIDNYSRLAVWRATADRLTSFDESVTAQTQAQRPDVAEGSTELATHDLALALPNGTPLLSGLSLRVAPGDSVIVKGPSGSGKSTLFRAFAGIWPFARGKVEIPADTMCIPQNPYFPDGALRDALAYPDPPSKYSDEALRQALEDALLPQLASRLDDEDAWSQKLSGGERQRLALARVFLKQPAWVLADEATSALDEAAEHTIYQRLLAMVRRKRGALVSIAHRPALDQFHQRQWHVEETPGAAGYRLRQA